MRCRWCHNSGHNQRTCPKMREYAKNNPNSYVNDKVKAYSQPRTCSYCRTQGHNRATCTKLIIDKGERVKKNAAFRVDLFNKMKAAGLGVGALVEMKNQIYGEDPTRTTRLITEICWDSIDFNNTYDAIMLDGIYHKYSLEVSRLTAEGYNDYSMRLEVGVSPDVLDNQVPKNWFNGQSPGIDAHFQK